MIKSVEVYTILDSLIIREREILLDDSRIVASQLCGWHIAGLLRIALSTCIGKLARSRRSPVLRTHSAPIINRGCNNKYACVYTWFMQHRGVCGVVHEGNSYPSLGRR